MNIHGAGKILLVTGLGVALLGLLIILIQKFYPGGRLPGDIFLRKGNFSFYFPLGASILLSILLTLVWNYIIRGR